MKVAATIARVLLGLMFTVFGLNGFLHFLPMQPMPGLAGQFMGALFASHYSVVVFLVQLVSGILLLVNRFVPLALTLIAPVIVNILVFHATMAPSGIVPGLITAICWFIVFYWERRAFEGLWRHHAPERP